MVILGNTKLLLVGVKKALDCSRIHSVTRVYEDLEFMVSSCSMKSTRSLLLAGVWVDAWGCIESHGTLPLYADERDGCNIRRRGWGQATATGCHYWSLQGMSSSKSTYASWIRYFDEGEESCSGLVLEALLAYWLSWFILPKGRRMAWTYVFYEEWEGGTAINISGALYARLDMSITKKSLGAATWCLMWTLTTCRCFYGGPSRL